MEKKRLSIQTAKFVPRGVDDLSELEGLEFGDVSRGFIIMNSDDDYSDTTPYDVSLDADTIIDSAKVTSTGMDPVEGTL